MFAQVLETLEESDPIGWNKSERDKALIILETLQGFVDRVFGVDLDLADIKERIADPEGYQGLSD